MVGKSICLNTYTELVKYMCKPYFCSSKKNWAKSDAYKTMCIAALPVMVKLWNDISVQSGWSIRERHANAYTHAIDLHVLTLG